ncbi:MAG TPA: Na/Pi cotransporter family protein [Candidatus Limadaptatus stercoripullorum]|uniref:Na/Pi cotransporter family protein n=1 Tax=Candidatus Limadaptatus stercoripullorum TaxID=2840846 RepID=A0A9D1NAA6_9FIRM|nr:Na/Pi cotransporter family protein [Candidatus Limadaptatus stercoripullorum]
MDIVTIVCQLIAGLGAFLIGVKLLSDNMEKLAATRLKDFFHRKPKDKTAFLPEDLSGLSDEERADRIAAAERAEIRSRRLNTVASRLSGVGIGTVTTAIVQSSSLTTVMIVGLVNAGVMSLSYATSLIMGANIGTCITGLIAALQEFPVAIIATALAGIGIFVALFSKKEKVVTASMAVAGLGLVFIGLELMAESMAAVRESDVITNAFASIDNPFLLFFLGIAVTGIVQSSSAVTSILISMAAAGIIIGDSSNSVMFVVLGTNIGTCVTALISSIGTNINARRAAVIHLLFNVIGSVIFFIILLLWDDMVDVTLGVWFKGLPSMQIAMFHTFFNIVCTIIFLPFNDLFVKAAVFLVRERKKKGETNAEIAPVSNRLDKRLLATPAIAVDNASAEAADTLKLAVKCLSDAVDGFLSADRESIERIAVAKEGIAERSAAIGDYLTKISAYDATLENERRITALHSCVGDINRVAELAENVGKYTRRSIKDDLRFSSVVRDEIKDMTGLIVSMSEKSAAVLEGGSATAPEEAAEIEERIDAKRKSLMKDHLKRLGSGECRPESSGVFINLVCNLERVGDHLNYIANSGETFQ